MLICVACQGPLFAGSLDIFASSNASIGVGFSKDEAVISLGAVLTDKYDECTIQRNYDYCRFRLEMTHWNDDSIPNKSQNNVIGLIFEGVSMPEKRRLAWAIGAGLFYRHTSVGDNSDNDIKPGLAIQLNWRISRQFMFSLKKNVFKDERLSGVRFDKPIALFTFHF